MHPEQVLDMQADLIAVTSNPRWLEVVEATLESSLMSVRTDDKKPNIDEARRSARGIADRMGAEAQKAYSYFVKEEMVELIEWAADGLDGTDAFRADEVPTANGFVYFEKPIRMRDVRGANMLVNAVLWFTATFSYVDSAPVRGFGIVFFNDQRLTPDDIAKDLLAGPLGEQVARDGRWGMIGMQGLVDGTRVGPREQDPTGYLDFNGEEYENPQPFTNFIRIMHAYWMILNQTVADVYEAETPRAFAKRARRANIPDRVTVVALRRSESHPHGDGDVDWHHRWLVRGHWRWQHVSEHHPLAEPDPDGGFRARVWVRPHVKGPEDKPLHLTDKVYALLR